MMEDQRLSIIQGIAHQTAIAVENIRLLESQQQETYISAVLLQVAQTVVSHNELSDVFASIVQITQILAGSQVCAIYLWDENVGGYKAVQVSGVSSAQEEALLKSVVLVEHANLLEYITLQEKILTLPISVNASMEPSSWLDLDPANQITADEIQTIQSPILIGVPLSVKGETYGVMLVVDPGEEKVYFNKRLEIISGIGRQTSLAIQNDRLQNAQVARERLEREFQLAREIQETFLPEDFPQPEGWQLDSRWRPAREVGGDFFDTFSLPNHKLALVIADVSDKGISAALYMTLTRTLIRTVAQQTSTPAKILAQVNDLLLRDTPHGMFITALLGILDTRTGELVYANAGHNLPILRKSGALGLETLSKGSMPLGILEKIEFKDNIVMLESGDTLLMYTDGITEAYVGEEFFGEERLIQAIQKAEHPDAPGMLEDIDLALMEFRGSSQPSDDVTALAVHRI
jgi:serine phosphatase RsbU (regulator of sigma subunit)